MNCKIMWIKYSITNNLECKSTQTAPLLTSLLEESKTVEANDGLDKIQTHDLLVMSKKSNPSGHLRPLIWRGAWPDKHKRGSAPTYTPHNSARISNVFRDSPWIAPCRPLRKPPASSMSELIMNTTNASFGNGMAQKAQITAMWLQNCKIPPARP